MTDHWMPVREPPPDASVIETVPGTGEALILERPVLTTPSWVTDNRLSSLWLINGGYVRMYSIGALSKAVKKSPVTVRAWISRGILPDSSWRTPGIKGTFRDAGRRMWTFEQVEAIARIANEEEVDTHRVHRGIDSTGFKGRLQALWREKGW